MTYLASHYPNHKIKHALTRRLYITPKLITIVGKICYHTSDRVAHPVVLVCDDCLSTVEQHTQFQTALSI